MQYLSDEWIASADMALRDAWSNASDKAERTVTVRWEVTGTSQGKVVYSMHLGADGAGVLSGPPPQEPDATMTVDYDTAVAIATAESSPQVAFMQGTLKLTGDVTVLIENSGALAALGDALGSLRERTEY